MPLDSVPAALPESPEAIRSPQSAPNAQPGQEPSPREITRPKPWEGRERYIRKKPRSLAGTSKATRLTAFNRAVNWLLPWGFNDYPGIGRGLVEIGGGRVEMKTALEWRRHSVVPSWMLDALLSSLRSRVETALSIIQELELVTAERKELERTRRHGFCRVDPETGMDGRQRSRQSRPQSAAL